MIEQFCREISIYLSKRNVVDEEDIEVIRFGLELILTQCIVFLLVLCLGLFLDCFWETIAFFLVLVILKKFSGGYHANTFFKCSMLTVVNYLLVIYISNYLYFWISILLLTVGFFVIYLYSPRIDHLSKLETSKYHDYSIIIYCLFTTFSIVCYLSSFIMLSNTISLTLFSIVFMIVLKVHSDEKT